MRIYKIIIYIFFSKPAQAYNKSDVLKIINLFFCNRYPQSFQKLGFIKSENVIFSRYSFLFVVYGNHDQYCLFQDNTSAVIDIANTDDLQSEPGNGERLIVLV